MAGGTEAKGGNKMAGVTQSNKRKEIVESYDS